MSVLISGDRPIDSNLNDRLGFVRLAQRLSVGIINQTSSDGLVLGLEGRWGSGKSSLLNLVVKNFEDLPDNEKPLVIEFKPWLVSDRDALLALFFAQLATGVESVALDENNSEPRDRRERKELAERLRKYAAGAEKLGILASNIPGFASIGNAIKSIAGTVKGTSREKSLLQQKRELDNDLSKLSKRIVVTIDDVDRLEPGEVIELLRLVRSVADFRSMIYILCFDGDILSRSIETAVKVPDGQAYLEKIIQISVAVPVPEPFLLRRWFAQDLSKFATTGDEDMNRRLIEVIDQEGGRRLKTPRTVVRAINALRLLIPALESEKIDLPDLVWLQLIRVDNQSLYRWIEDYSGMCSTLSGHHVVITEESKSESFKDLNKSLDNDNIDFDDYKYELNAHLPRIITMHLMDDKDKVPLFAPEDDDARRISTQARRLSSPDHYRIYFALVQPSAAPKAEDFAKMASVADRSSDAVADFMIYLSQQEDPPYGNKAELMLDRLRGRELALFSSIQASNVFLAFSDVLDQAVVNSRNIEFGEPRLWTEADLCLPIIKSVINSDSILEIIEAAFSKGRALGWLTSVLRDETFNHGIYGNRAKSESEWIFSAQEFAIIAECMIRRYRSMKFEDFAKLPNTMSALFAWAQAGDPDGPKEMISSVIVTDEGLLNVLQSMSSLIRSSGGSYIALSRRNIESLLDYDQSRMRVEKMAKDNISTLNEKANNIMERFNVGDSF